MPAELPELSDDQNDTGSDLRSALMSAYDETPPETTAPAPKEKTPATPSAPKDTTAPVRGDNGRFVAKADAPPVTIESVTGPSTGRETATAVVRKPPASMTPELHDSWTNLAPAIQDYVLKRETDYSKGIEERSVRIKGFEEQARNQSELDRALTPYREKWRLAGLTDHQQITKLLAAQDLLNRSPADGLRYLAQEFRLNPAEIFNAAQAQSAPNPLADKIAQLEHKIAAREEQEAAREKQTQEEQSATIQSEIDKFKADPANVHFDVVKEDMSLFLANGRASTLQEAYDKAVRLNSTLETPQPAGQGQDDAKAKADAEKAAAAAKVAKAKTAAVSVKGGPTGTAANAPKATLRDELLANWGD